MKCKDCEYLQDVTGEDIVRCQKHRKPDKNGKYTVLCRKCGNILTSYDPDDSMCAYCV